MRTIETRPGNGLIRYYHRAEVTDATSEPLGIPASHNDVLVVVSPSTSARLQFTISSKEAINAGTATWVDWEDGDVSEARARVISGTVSALRLVSVGASIWEVSL